MSRKWLLVLSLALFTLLRAGSLCAALKVGDQAPKFTGIVGTDDKKHNLSDYKDSKLLVLVFTCNHCPVARAYEKRLVALQRDYKTQGVQVVAVNVNNIEPDRLDKMKAAGRTAEVQFSLLVRLDPENRPSVRRYRHAPRLPLGPESQNRLHGRGRTIR